MNTIQHPVYASEYLEWEKYRYTYRGGRDFVDKYLKAYSTREDDDDFSNRRDMTYCPNFAGAAVREINNAIFSRMPDVVRINDGGSYSQVLDGSIAGVDYDGASMDHFIGCEVLPELLITRKVGVYIDMPTEVPLTLRDRSKVHPYFYIYTAEDIQTWAYGEPGSGHQFTKLLLRDNFYQKDEIYELVVDTEVQYRLLEVLPNGGGVQVTFMTEKGEFIEKKILDLPKIPFVLFELSHSLLRDAADYQIALLNVESADINFAWKANFPLFTEQIGQMQALEHFKVEGQENEAVGGDKQIDLGSTQGRQYLKGLERPDFIHPSPEPLRVSMEKEEQLKRDIRQLVNLSVSHLMPKQQSRESKEFDNRGLENGLSLIALELETGERKLAEFWNIYESNKSVPVVSYPRHFDLRTDKERRQEADELNQLAHKIPSQKFKREVLKRVVKTLMGGRVKIEDLHEMYKEVDDAPSVTADPAIIHKDLEAGLVTEKTASEIRGYPENEVDQARKEHADRLARIAAAQGGGGQARGVDDMQIDQETSQEEKQAKPKRGKDKL